MAEGICSIPDCECPVLARGWCQPHYMRWRRNGDPHLGRYAHRCRPPRPCAVGGCRNRRHYCDGYCELHYLRWVKSGGDIETLALAGVRAGALNSKWTGDDASYASIHARLRRHRGFARQHPCMHCGEPAGQWAYDRTCPDEKIERRRGRLVPYSTNLDRYMPLCLACHTRFDKRLPRR